MRVHVLSKSWVEVMSIGLFSLSLIFIFSAFVDCKYILSSNVPDRYDRHEVIFWIRRTEINLLKADAEAFSRNDNDCLKELILFRDGRKSQKETAMSSALRLNKILAEYKVESSLVTISGDFVWAKANISTWEKIFSTRFSMLKDGSGIYPSVYRAATYKLDDNIAPSVQAVFNVLENPVYVAETREVYSSVKYFMRNFVHGSESPVVAIFGTNSYLNTVANMASIHGEFTPSPGNNSPSSM